MKPNCHLFIGLFTFLLNLTNAYADPTIYSGLVLGHPFELLSEGMNPEMKLKFKKIRDDQALQAKEFEKLTPEQRRKRYENDYKTLTEEDKVLLAIVKDNQYKEFNSRSFDCEIPENIKGTISFKEEILVAYNFEKGAKVFDNYEHLITRRDSDLNSKYTKMFDVKNINQNEEYRVVGCKRKRDFDLSDKYLLLEGKNSKMTYMLEYKELEEFKKEISNNYSMFFNALENHDYKGVKEYLGKINLKLVEFKASMLLVKINDEKMLDIFTTSKDFNAELFLRNLSQTKNETLYIKAYPLIRKELRELYFSDALIRGYSTKVLNLYDDLKKGDIVKDHHLGLISYACGADNSNELISILSKKGFNFKETNESGANALHHVAQFGSSYKNKKCIDYLLGIGLEINSIDDSGDTPLHKASSVLNKDIVKYLISKGASVTISNKKGKLPVK